MVAPVQEARDGRDDARADDEQLSLEEIEHRRQEQLILGAIDYLKRDPLIPDEGGVRESRIIRVNEMVALARQVASGEKKLGDFEQYETEHEESPDYFFLSQQATGVGVSWWGIAWAIIKPQVYGVKIQSTSEVRGTIGRRS